MRLTPGDVRRTRSPDAPFTCQNEAELSGIEQYLDDEEARQDQEDRRRAW